MTSQRELEWLRRMRDLSHLLASERDLGRLLPAILAAAIELTRAERGFLVRVRTGVGGEEYRVGIEAAQGFDPSSAPGQISRTVVERVLQREPEGLITTSDAHRDLLEASSVQANQVLSILCAPLRLRGRTLGVLYLDSRLEAEAFAAGDLPILRALADQAALALETAELLDGPADQSQASVELHQLESCSRAGAPPSLAVFGRLIGQSPVMGALFEDVERAARTWDPVLIMGETGSGKKLVAREIHERSDRAKEPFLQLNAAREGADGLLSSLRLTGRGTLVIHDAAELAPDAQLLLADALREGRVRTGGGRSRRVHCRLMVSTRHDLLAKVAAGEFREDLYYRLDVLRIIVPPLRQRVGDVGLLFEHLVERVGERKLLVSPNGRKLLEGYAWPGNVLELEGEVRRLLAQGEYRVSSRHLSDSVREGRGVSRAPSSFSGKTLSDVEREMVRAALEDCGGNKSRTARQLGVPRSTLYHLLERYGLS